MKINLSVWVDVSSYRQISCTIENETTISSSFTCIHDITYLLFSEMIFLVCYNTKDAAR